MKKRGPSGTAVHVCVQDQNYEHMKGHIGHTGDVRSGPGPGSITTRDTSPWSHMSDGEA